MAKFDPEFYDEDKNYQVSVFLPSMSVPFRATRKEVDTIFRLHSRPKWLRPRNFGVTTGDGNTMLKIDLSKVIVIEATVAGGVEVGVPKPGQVEQSQDITDGTERSEP